MKKLIAGIIVAVLPIAAYAACTTHTYIYNGRMVTCTTCCTGAVCTTNCF